jgi:hypothetical protein
VIPNEILGLTHQREVLFNMKELVSILVRANNDLIQALDGAESVYLDHLRMLERKLTPAFNKIHWSQKPAVIENFVHVSIFCEHYN